MASKEAKLRVKELLSANVTSQLLSSFMDEIKTSNTDDVFDMNDDMSLIQNLPPQQRDLDNRNNSDNDTDTVFDIDVINQIMNDTVDGDNRCSSLDDSDLQNSKKPAAASPCLSSSSGPKKRKMSRFTKTKSSSSFAHHETKNVETDSGPSDGPKRRRRKQELAFRSVGVDTQNSKENLVKTDPKRRHPCLYCEKRFHSASNKLRHEMRIHTGERPYTCDQCEKSFVTKADARKHKNRWHSKHERKR